MGRHKGLSIAEQRKLARLSARPDAPIAMETRVWFFEKIRDRREWLWEQFEWLLAHGTREDEVRIRLLQLIFAKVMPDQREVVSAPANEAGLTPVVAIKVVGIDRGTVRARQHALEIQAEKRSAPQIGTAG